MYLKYEINLRRFNIMPNAEIVEQMIDYIINHKDNLNGNILMEMLE